MNAPAAPFRVFLDAGVPDSVGATLAAAGHEVIRHRDVLPERTSDDEVYATAIELAAVLVVIDRDARRAARRYESKAPHDRFKSLSIIQLACLEPLAPSRVEQALELIQLEWAFCLRKTSRRLWVEVGQHYIRTNR